VAWQADHDLGRSLRLRQCADLLEIGHDVSTAQCRTWEGLARLPVANGHADTPAAMVEPAHRTHQFSDTSGEAPDESVLVSGMISIRKPRAGRRSSQGGHRST